MHPSGLVLHPEIEKMIENIHYLVNHNLPVNKYVPIVAFVEIVRDYA